LQIWPLSFSDVTTHDKAIFHKYDADDDDDDDDNNNNNNNNNKLRSVDPSVLGTIFRLIPGFQADNPCAHSIQYLQIFYLIRPSIFISV
jgi:hypothetical protein